MTNQELLTNLQHVKSGYISLLNEVEVMKNWGKVQLEALYSTQIGKYEIELLELQIELKALKKKIQLAHQAINLGGNPDFKQIEATVAEITRKAYAEITTAKDKVALGKAVLSNLSSPEDSVELRKVFRNIAKALHPDINPNLTPEQQEVWHQFHAAYKTGDLERFKALEIVYAEVVDAAEREPKELSDEEMLLQTTILKNGIVELGKQKKKLESEFPFTLSENLLDEDWLAEKQLALLKETDKFKASVAEKKADYELIKEAYER
ncbi:MAG: hypothetical protein ACXWVV_03785 [Kaistella sp.]